MAVVIEVPCWSCIRFLITDHGQSIVRVLGAFDEDIAEVVLKSYLMSFHARDHVRLVTF